MIQVIKQPIRIALKVEEVHLARRFFKRVGEVLVKKEKDSRYQIKKVPDRLE